MIMDKKRGIVGALKLVFILLLLLLLNPCLSSSHRFNPSLMQESISLPITVAEGLSTTHWPRRMLRSTTPIKPHHEKNHHAYSSNISSDSTSNYPVHQHAGALGDSVHASGIRNTQAAQCTSMSAHCANNGTTIDPRYGVEKRLVPTGPNPLHN